MRDDLMWAHVDRDVVASFSAFYHAVNERSEKLAGLRDSYVAPDAALGEEVEYFHPVITYDDRMRYICENLVLNDRASRRSRLCNVVISHFYGARGIHSVLTGDPRPETALVDFELLAREQRESFWDNKPGPYTASMRELSLTQKRKGLPFWGTTELHSSIQAAGRKFVNHAYGTTGEFGTPLNVCEWIASWINKGVTERMLGASSFHQLYSVFREQEGVGPYYAYHGAAGAANMPAIHAYHGEDFCDPGPGACETAVLMFPGLTKKQVPLADRVVWLKNNQRELMDVPTIHPSRHNVVVGGASIYPEPQDDLKTYGTEVAMCQYAVYCRLRDNPELISRRKVARVQQAENNGLEGFFS